ncbi:MAG: GNAT family N-acetyltransferase [Candidatus Dormibacteria bacterium]
MPADADVTSPSGDITVEEVPLEVVLRLRARILRAGRPLEAARSKQDPLPGTLHLAARAADGRVVGVVTLFPENTELAGDRRAYRFRGMAVDDALQGRGIGRALMRALVRMARDAGAEVLWANGRDSALGFYERIGFRTVGDGFVDDEMHLGHHVVIAGIDEVDA